MPRNEEWIDEDWEDEDDYLEDVDEDEDDEDLPRRHRYRARSRKERKRPRRRAGFYQEDSSALVEDFADQYRKMDWSEMEREIRAGRYTPTSRDPWAAQVLYKLLKDNNEFEEKKRKRLEKKRGAKPATERGEGCASDSGQQN